MLTKLLVFIKLYFKIMFFFSWITFFPVHSIPVSEQLVISYLGNSPFSPQFLATLLIFWTYPNEVFIHSHFRPILGISRAGISIACLWTLIFNHIIIGLGDGWDLTVQSPSACQSCGCFLHHLAMIFTKLVIYPLTEFKCHIFAHRSGISAIQTFMFIP